MQFTKVKREVNDPIGSFNNRFNDVYTKLQAPYVVDDSSR